jgi:predicted thioesterase
VVFKLDLNTGIKLTTETVVTEKDTAAVYGSGGVNVYATPAMIGRMENASMSAVEPYLDKGLTTVGTKVEIKHVAATPVGMKVVTSAELIEVDGSRLLFKVEAYDEAGLIGEGTHERYIVNLDKFMNRVNSKIRK